MANGAKGPLAYPLWFALGIGVVVTFLYCGAFVLDALDPRYEFPAGLHVLMATVVGGVFGGTAAVSIARRGSNGQQQQ